MQGALFLHTPLEKVQHNNKIIKTINLEGSRISAVSFASIFFYFQFIATYLPRSFAPECVQMCINANSKSLARTVKKTPEKKRCDTGPIYLSKTKLYPFSRQPKNLSQLKYDTFEALISREMFVKF